MSTAGNQSCTARALNILSMLTAYQAEICKDFAQTQDPATWEEIPVITDLCLRIQRCTVQATGRALGTMVIQKRVRLLNLLFRPAHDCEALLCFTAM